MLNLLEMKRWNRWLIGSHVLILSILLLSYLLMIAFRSSGYNPELYKKAYLYMMTLSVILISCLIPIWKESWTKAKILEIALEILCLNFSHVPLILMLFSIGQLHGVNLLLPLWIQILWSGVLFTLKDFFSALNLSEQWKNYIFIIWIGFMLFISLIFLFLYSQYAELVLTTIYDKDIPKGFFLNPLLTISGLLYYQTGGTTQMNMEPVLIFSLFWCSFILLCYGVTHSYQRRARGIVYEKSKN